MDASREWKTEIALHPFREETVKFSFGRFVMWWWMRCEPLFTFVYPGCEHIGGNGVRGPEGDEVNATRLSPMR